MKRLIYKIKSVCFNFRNYTDYRLTMKKKTAYIIITAAITLAAFFIGKNTTSTPTPDLTGYIPISDFYTTSTDDNGYLTLHVGDYSRVGDDLTGRTYESVVEEINQR